MATENDCTVEKCIDRSTLSTIWKHACCFAAPQVVLKKMTAAGYSEAMADTSGAGAKIVFPSPFTYTPPHRCAPDADDSNVFVFFLFGSKAKNNPGDSIRTRMEGIFSGSGPPFLLWVLGGRLPCGGKGRDSIDRLRLSLRPWPFAEPCFVVRPLLRLDSRPAPWRAPVKDSQTLLL